MNDKAKTAKDTPVATKKKKKVNAEQINSAHESVVVNSKPDRNWNFGAVFWGLLLVTFGGLLLLGNLGVVEVSWSELWRLWPLLIVAMGFSVLATAHWLWKVLSLVFIAAAIFSVIWVGTGQYEMNTTGLTNQNVSVDSEQGVTQADVTVRAGASKLTIDSDDMSEVVLAKLQSSGLQIAEDSNYEGTTQKIVLSGSNQRNIWFGPSRNIWDITVTERLPMKLTIDAGASNVNADLSEARLTNLSVKAGASSTVITLGDKEANLNVDVDSGVSSTTLRIPKDSGVAMNFEGGLSSREFDDLKEISEGEYQSDNYETATNRITINADAGLASFKIERY
ncbi:MAG: toast rack family protein [Candidatus Saccharimonadales bacterium]